MDGLGVRPVHCLLLTMIQSRMFLGGDKGRVLALHCCG